jgi:hypothetical protein
MVKMQIQKRPIVFYDKDISNLLIIFAHEKRPRDRTYSRTKKSRAAMSRA